MRFSTLIPVLLAAGVANAQFGGQGQGQNKGQNGQNAAQNAQNTAQNGQNNAQNGQNNNAGGGGNNALALNPANVQKASQSDGSAGGQEAGQAKSETDAANFINFCTGKTLTNGLQTTTGSCNGIVMGDIPASNKMISAVFQSPTNDQDFTPNSAITFSVKIANLQAGSFTNPDNTYYAAPQALQGGVVVGHTHISVQDLGGSANPANAPDAETFAFFKGVNDAGDGNGLLSADLAAGLPAGTYRVCSMTSASNHQPVVMPVAQRGPQDDCVRFTVGANNNGGQNNNGQNGQQNGQQGQGQQGQAQQAQGQQGQAQQGQAQQGQQQQGQQAQGQQGQAQQGQGGAAGRGRGRGRGRLNRPRFAARDFIA